MFNRYKTHHAKCFYEDSSISCDEFYEAYLNQDRAEWDQLYQSYDAAVDWTASCFYKSLFKKYPDAKVLLTVRSADSWYKSIKNTMTKVVVVNDSANNPNHQRYPIRRLMRAVAMDGIVMDPERVADEEHVKKLFYNHIEEVKAVIPADQLLIMELGEGWERMCKFLGKEVPDAPYPSVNSTAEFEKYFIKGENRPNNMSNRRAQVNHVT